MERRRSRTTLLAFRLVPNFAVYSKTMIIKVRAAINKEFRRLTRLAVAVIALLLIVQTVGSYLLYSRLWQHSFLEWYRELFPATLLLLIVGVIALYATYTSRVRLLRSSNLAIASELHMLQTTIERFEALQMMASTLSATLSFEQVIDQAVDVCGLALEDLDVTRDSLIGTVFLFDGQQLVPLQPPVDDGIRH